MPTPFRVCHINTSLYVSGMSFGYKQLSRLGLRPHALPVLGKDAFVLLHGWPLVVSPSYFLLLLASLSKCSKS